MESLDFIVMGKAETNYGKDNYLELQTTSFFMVVSTGWFQIITLKMVVSPNIH